MTDSIAQRNKAIVRKVYEDCLNKRNMAELKDLVSPEYVGIRGQKGVAAFEEPVSGLIKAFPDIQWKIETLVAEGNTVMIRWTWKATHTAPYQQFAATAKTVTNSAMAIYELNDRRIVSNLVLTDRYGFLQELGVLPDVRALADRSAPRFIDKFFVPKAAITEFKKRMDDNRRLIKTLPGFLMDEVYEQADAAGNLNIITIACWQNTEAMSAAKGVVQAEYVKTGFNMQKFLQESEIKMERGIYKEVRE